MESLALSQKPPRRRFLPEMPRLRRLPPQLNRLLEGNLLFTVFLTLVFVSFGVAGAILLGRIYDEPLLTVIVLVICGYLAL